MTPEFMVVAGAVFVAVAALAGIAGFMVLERSSPERARIDQLSRRTELTLPTDDSGHLLVGGESVAPWLKAVLPKSPKEMGRIRAQLARGGYHGTLPTTIYALAEMILPLVGGLAAYWAFGGGTGWLIVILAAVVGYMAPSFYLGQIIKKYKKQIRNGLADALDLLIVCVEAGSGLDQAIMKATGELAVSYPALSRELGMITTEVRAGKPRLEAFKNFAQRTKVEDVQ